jgi:phosphoglycolate phosphatase
VLNGLVRLVLWDIDKTLVDYDGIGLTWYREALASLYGVTLRTHPEMHGRTERWITTQLLGLHGIEADEERIQRMFTEFLRLAEAARPTMGAVGRALPGAAEVLQALAGRDDVVQSLVTGNLAVVAGYKLEPFGLDRHVDLEIGGYGAISLDRHDLVAGAMALAGAKHGAAFEASSVIVLGDSPHDMTAARHHGTVAIGVATGRNDAATLRAAGAHTVLPDLADTGRVLDAVLSS